MNLFDKPISIGKIGGIEASHLCHRMATGQSALVRGSSLAINAGIECRDTRSLDLYLSFLLDSIKNLDYCLEWCPEQGDKAILDACFTGMRLYQFSDLEPFWGDVGWHQQLVGKRVLVVSPLADTIEAQVLNYEKLWGATIDVQVIRSAYPSGLTGEAPVDWETKYIDLCLLIDECYFDLAIIGCGGLSLLIADYIKLMHKKTAIHLGGAVQLLFGIRGKRWDHLRESWYGTDHWIRPLPHEVPKFSERVEGGCYW